MISFDLMTKNYSAVTLDSVESLLRSIYGNDKIGDEAAAKDFLGDKLQGSGFEISYGVLPTGGSSPFVHAHKLNEELYIFLSGVGVIELDGDSVDVKTGSFVRVAPPVKRFIKNTSKLPIIYLCIQTKAGSLEAKTADDAIIY
jgi:mannose-6-phosphate isomerase-like protein (cupin superfamily)